MTTRFGSADDQQVTGRDLMTNEAVPGPHKLFMAASFTNDLPDEVCLDVQVIAQEVSASPVAAVAVSAHPLAVAAVSGYRRNGALPGAGAPLAMLSTTTANEEGGLTLLFRMPRAAIPAGTERLAMPILVRYADGWVYLHFYETGLPGQRP